MYVIENKGESVNTNRLTLSLYIAYDSISGDDMRERDRLRLLKIEIEISECEEKLDVILDAEAQNSRFKFLGSKALQVKYKTLLRMRTNMKKVMREQISRRQIYTAVLKQRREDLAVEEKELDNIKRNIAQIEGNAAVLHNDPTIQDEIKIQTKLLFSQQIRVRNKERAVNNWLKKSELFADDVTVLRASKGKVISIEKAENADEYKLVDNTAMQQLQNDPKWNVKAENNATLDLLTRPEEEQKDESVD